MQSPASEAELWSRLCCCSLRAGGSCGTSREDALCWSTSAPLDGPYVPWGGLGAFVLPPGPAAVGRRLAEAVFELPPVAPCGCKGLAEQPCAHLAAFVVLGSRCWLQDAYQMILVGHLQWEGETGGLKVPLHEWSWPHDASLVGWCWRCP